MSTTTRLWAAFCAAGLYFCATPAFAQGHRFPDKDVERAKAFWVQNATGGNSLDCLKTLNKALRTLYDDDGLQLGTTVDRSMAALQRAGLAGETRVFGFLDEDGHKTFGVTQPKKLRESVWDWMLSQSQGEPGYYMFGFSPLDGIHSVVLTMDTHDPADPKVYWSDQWSSKGGWKLYATKAELDGEIEYRTSSWWRMELPKKFKSDAKLYPLIPARPEPKTTLEAEVIRAQNLYVRSAPRKAGDTHLLDAQGRRRMIHLGERFQVLAREGRWVQLRLADGTEAWAHSWFLRVEEVPVVSVATGLSGSLGGQP